MQDYQREFIEFCLANQALRFGEFKLKSGRTSPYFFNAGLFNTGAAIAQVGRCYAAAVNAANIDYDILYGPAYKGIPLVTITAAALALYYQQNKPYCFNRKEIKDHGEGGNVVGAPLKGRVLIIDDVITAGTAIRESAQIIQVANATMAGIVIALDRQERGQGEVSAIQEVEKAYAIKVFSIITLQHLIEYLQFKQNEKPQLEKVLAYQQQYGSNPNGDYGH